MMDQPSEPGEENFAAMLEAFSPGKTAEVRIGDRVKGRIISIGKESVFVDTGMKIDAVVERGELLDADQNLTVAEGDELELYVAAVGEGEIRLSRAISGAGGAQALTWVRFLVWPAIGLLAAGIVGARFGKAYWYVVGLAEMPAQARGEQSRSATRAAGR